MKKKKKKKKKKKQKQEKETHKRVTKTQSNALAHRNPTDAKPTLMKRNTTWAVVWYTEGVVK